MSGRPLVSVCMPCYNAEKYVGEAIESVLNQTYKHIELIVVNDGSTDQSGKVLGKYKPRGIKVINQKNQGQSAAANRALAEARGKYVKFFDADDLLSSNCIEEQVKRLAGSEDEVALARWGRFYDNDLRTFKINPEAVWQEMKSIDWLVQGVLKVNAMMQCGLWLIPKAVLKKTGGWLENLSLINDFEFFCRILSNVKKIKFCEGSILYYRSGVLGSLSGQKNRKARESECESVLLGTTHILKKRSDAQAKLACANACQHLIYDLYPEHSDLRALLEERVGECGGARIEPSGGKYFQFLRPWFGWKLARRLQRIIYG